MCETGASGAIVWIKEKRIVAAKTRLDEFAPAYQFHEFHSTRVRATPHEAFAAIKAVAGEEILFLRTLVWIRRGGRAAPPSVLNPPKGEPVLEVATRTGFLLLAEDADTEIVLGNPVIAPRGFRLTARFGPEDYKAIREPGYALGSMNFLVQRDAAGNGPSGDAACIVSTETRVFATDPATTRRFANYWRMIYPGSALIRRMWLRAIKRRAERARSSSGLP